MTLTEKLDETKVESDNYIGSVEVWRSDRGGHKKIVKRIMKKNGEVLWGLIDIPPEQVYRHVMRYWYSDKKYEEAIESMEEKLDQYEADYEKFNGDS